MTNTKTCAIDGCDKPVAYRGYCSGHLARIKGSGDITTPLRPRQPRACTVPDCGRRSYSGGLCSAHYRRQNRTGATDHETPIRRPGQTPSASVFWCRVDSSQGATECWPWTGAKTSLGYGRLSFGGQRYIAHRLAYQLSAGPIPEGMHVCHSCDNPPCCNPAHLWLGTRTDNMRDMLAKGRGCHGPNRPGLKGEANQTRVAS